MKKGNWFWGTIFIAAAVLLVVGQLGILKEISVWSLVFAVFFGAMFISGIVYRQPAGVLFSLAFLYIIFDEPLGITGVSPWTALGAALLGTIGISIIRNPGKKNGDWRTEKYGEQETYREITENLYQGQEETDSVPDDQEEYTENQEETGNFGGDCLEFVTRFGESIKYVNSEDFCRARVECKFGGCTIYLDNAMIKSGRAVLELDLFCAGIQLYVPSDWKILNSANVLMAGIDEKNNRRSPGETTLILTGDVKLSGVEIIYI